MNHTFPNPTFPDPHIIGVDLSHWDNSADWPLVAASGVGFAILKATDGGGGVDPRFAGWWAASKAAGLPRGAYHFLEPMTGGSAQASHFFSVYTPEEGDIRPTLDIETFGGTPQSFDAIVSSAIAAVKAKTGFYPFIYSYIPFFLEHLAHNPDVRKCPDWLAEYQVAEPRGGLRPAIWQYTETGLVRGIGKQGVDMNVFYGDKAALALHRLPAQEN